MIKSKGAGVDIVELEKLGSYTKRKDFLDKVFTKRELLYAREKDGGKRMIEHLATTFAAKEAVFKALGKKFFNPRDIEILRDRNGAPYVSGNKKVILSLSYSNKHAVAFAVLKD